MLKKQTFSQNLGSGGISQTFTFNTDFRLVSIMLHGSAALTETVTVTLDNGVGANYDTIITTISLSSNQDSFTAYGENYKFLQTDGIKITSTNAGAQIVYGTIIVEEL